MVPRELGRFRHLGPGGVIEGGGGHLLERQPVSYLQGDSSPVLAARNALRGEPGSRLCSDSPQREQCSGVTHSARSGSPFVIGLGYEVHEHDGQMRCLEFGGGFRGTEPP